MSEPTRVMFTKSLFEKFGTVVTKSEIYPQSPQKCISSDLIAYIIHIFNHYTPYLHWLLELYYRLQFWYIFIVLLLCNVHRNSRGLYGRAVVSKLLSLG